MCLLRIAKIPLSSARSHAHRILEDQFISRLQTCKSSNHLRQIQTQIIIHGNEQNRYVAPRLLKACVQLSQMHNACQVFDRIPHPDTAAWNIMLHGFMRNNSHGKVIDLFGRMKSMDVVPNCFTLPIVLKACAERDTLTEGEEVHGVVVKGGYGANSYVGTALIDMYSGFEAIMAARKVFAEMTERNVVAWTSIINGYISCGDVVSARQLFDSAPEPDIVLWNTMVSGYITMGDMINARKLFDHMPEKDVMSWNTLLHGYAINGNVEECKRVFEEMPERNTFSWNGLIGGYARNGQHLNVLTAFKSMLADRNVLPNDATFVTVLSACARLGALDLGKWLHVYADNSGYKENIYVGNALIDMYSKCGTIENAVDVFKNMDRKDLISWNTIINGLAMHGHGFDALSVFSLMKNSGVKLKPDGITFIGVLCACTHLGLVDDGMSYFNSMVNEYLIQPQIEHYGCLVDLLSRAGLLTQAVDFVNSMPIEADAVIWANLLGACRVHKNVKIAELALEHLIKFEPNNPSNFVMLSNIYGDHGRWEDVARLKVAERDTGCKKLPGCSLIEVDHQVVEFYSLDERHPKTKEIYEGLWGLVKLLRSCGFEQSHLEDEEEV